MVGNVQQFALQLKVLQTDTSLMDPVHHHPEVYVCQRSYWMCHVKWMHLIKKRKKQHIPALDQKFGKIWVPQIFQWHCSNSRSTLLRNYTLHCLPFKDRLFTSLFGQLLWLFFICVEATMETGAKTWLTHIWACSKRHTSIEHAQTCRRYVTRMIWLVRNVVSCCPLLSNRRQIWVSPNG